MISFIPATTKLRIKHCDCLVKASEEEFMGEHRNNKQKGEREGSIHHASKRSLGFGTHNASILDATVLLMFPHQAAGRSRQPAGGPRTIEGVCTSEQPLGHPLAAGRGRLESECRMEAYTMYRSSAPASFSRTTSQPQHQAAGSSQVAARADIMRPK